MLIVLVATPSMHYGDRALPCVNVMSVVWAPWAPGLPGVYTCMPPNVLRLCVSCASLHNLQCNGLGSYLLLINVILYHCTLDVIMLMFAKFRFCSMYVIYKEYVP